MSGFRQAWTPDNVTTFKQRLLRYLMLLSEEARNCDLNSLDVDLQVVLKDACLAERLSTEFSWAEMSEIILASRVFGRTICVWALYPGLSESILALTAKPPEQTSSEPIHLWNVLTKDGRGDHYCALQPFLGAS